MISFTTVKFLRILRAAGWLLRRDQSKELAATCMNIVKEDAQDLYLDSQSSGVPATVPNPLVSLEKT
jgi:hypothetical protein